jgi:hypothetical protein
VAPFLSSNLERFHSNDEDFDDWTSSTVASNVVDGAAAAAADKVLWGMR